MSSRIVTVFGASGFIGRHVVRALAKDGWRVRAAVRRPQLAEFLRTAGMVGQVQPFKADVTHEGMVRGAIAGSDAVVNLVGVFAGAFGKKADAVNREGAARVARAAAASGATRLIHVSALGVGADAPSVYGRTKAAGEQAVREAFPTATILRPAPVFGPEDQLFNRFANLARYTPILPLFGGGTTKLQPVFVGDVAAAVRETLNRAETAGETYELGGPDVMTLKEIVELTRATVERRRLTAPVPFAIARAMAWPMALLPKPPLTPDQVDMLRGDAVVSEGAKTLTDLGIAADAAEAIVPSYLWRFRKTGQFEATAH